MNNSVKPSDAQEPTPLTDEYIALGAVQTKCMFGNGHEIDPDSITNIEEFATKAREPVFYKVAVFEGKVKHTLDNGDTIEIPTKGERIVSRHYLNMQGPITTDEFLPALKQLLGDGLLTDNDVMSYERWKDDPSILSFVYKWVEGESPIIYPVRERDTVHFKVKK